MKLTLEAEHLSAALNKAVGIVEKRSTIPILENVLIEAEGESVRLTTTDLERRVTLTIGAEVSTPGSITANAHKLSQIASKAADGSQVKLSLGKQLSVSAGTARYKLATLPADDFPLPHAPNDEGVGFELSGAELEQLFCLTRFAISTDETRFYLNGTFLEVSEVDGQAHIMAVATDGHRLSRYVIPAPDRLAGDGAFDGVIVPRKTVSQLARLLKDYGEPVGVNVRDSTITFELGHLRLESKLIAGEYPDWRRAVPPVAKQSAKVNVADLADALDRAVIVAASSVKHPPGVRLAIKGQSISVTSTNRDVGDTGADSFEALAVDGEEFEVGLNGRYLAEVLSNWDASQVDIRIKDPSTPVLFLPSDCAGSKDAVGQMSLVMPMRW